MRVLVIEDNQILSRNLVRYLSSREIFAQASLSWNDWLKNALLNYYDIIILDINLPWIDGREICRQLREKWKDVSIIILTSNSTNEDIVTWLDLWADDYLVKPFEYNELLARMNSIVRRKNKNKTNTLIFIWNLKIDLQKQEIFINEESIHLSKLEFELLKFLSTNRWVILTREEIYKKVWWEYDNDFIYSKTIDVYIGYLRKKLWKELIETKKGYWFLIKDDE